MKGLSDANGTMERENKLPVWKPCTKTLDPDEHHPTDVTIHTSSSSNDENMDDYEQSDRAENKGEICSYALIELDARRQSIWLRH